MALARYHYSFSTLHQLKQPRELGLRFVYVILGHVLMLVRLFS